MKARMSLLACGVTLLLLSALLLAGRPAAATSGRAAQVEAARRQAPIQLRPTQQVTATVPLQEAHRLRRPDMTRFAPSAVERYASDAPSASPSLREPATDHFAARAFEPAADDAAETQTDRRSRFRLPTTESGANRAAAPAPSTGIEAESQAVTAQAAPPTPSALDVEAADGDDTIIAGESTTEADVPDTAQASESEPIARPLSLRQSRSAPDTPDTPDTADADVVDASPTITTTAMLSSPEPTTDVTANVTADSTPEAPAATFSLRRDRANLFEPATDETGNDETGNDETGNDEANAAAVPNPAAGSDTGAAVEGDGRGRTPFTRSTQFRTAGAEASTTTDPAENPAADTATQHTMRMPGQSRFAPQVDTRGTDDNQVTGVEGDEDPAATASDGYTEYVTIQDGAGSIQVDVPAAWTDVRSGAWILDRRPVGVSLWAAADLQEYETSWSTSGMFIGASANLAEQLTPAEMLELYDFSDQCAYNSRLEYGDANYTGAYDVWTDCGGVETILITLAAQPVENNGPVVLLNAKIVNDADMGAFEQLLATFATADRMAGLAAADESTNESTAATASAPTAVADAAIDDDAPAPPSDPSTPLARVNVSTLNVRSGPGVAYPRIGQVRRADQLPVIGQTGGCAWLQVRTPGGAEGWVSGGSQYTTLNTLCGTLTEATAPPPEPSPAQEVAANVTAQVEAATAAASAQDDASAAARLGCYLFQEQAGAEVTVTLTRARDGWNRTFILSRRSEREECFEPGSYTYTFDAPPPYGSLNGELVVNAGERRTIGVFIEESN